MLFRASPDFCMICIRHGGRFLDRATVTKSSGLRDQDSVPAINLWKQCPVSQVEDVKQVVRLLPLWLTFVPAAAIQALLVTFFTLQGHTLESHINHNFTIPPASLQCVTTGAFLLCILIYAMVGKRLNFTPLRQAGVSMLLSVLIMVVAATTEAKRLKVSIKSSTFNPHVQIAQSCMKSLFSFEFYTPGYSCYNLDGKQSDV